MGFKSWLSGKKKILGTLGALLLYGFGIREGWDPEQTRIAANFLFGSVLVEGTIDAFGAIAARWPRKE
jgi:hypothetical protein